MLGKTVIYKIPPVIKAEGIRERVGIITRVYESGEVDLAVFGNIDDFSYPLDGPVKKFGKVKIGDGIGECQFTQEDARPDSIAAKVFDMVTKGGKKADVHPS